MTVIKYKTFEQAEKDNLLLMQKTVVDLRLDNVGMRLVESHIKIPKGVFRYSSVEELQRDSRWKIFH